MPQGVGVRGERDRRGEDAEVDDPEDRGRRRRAGVVDQPAQERQAGDGADRARQPGDVQGRKPGHERLLEDHADRVDGRRQQAERHAQEVAAAAVGVGGADQDDAGEREGQSDREVRRELLAEEHRRQHRDQDRRDLEQHRGRAGVHVVLALVQRHVVDAEPQHPDRHDRDPLAPGRPGHPLGHRRHHAERDRAHEQATERERAGREVLAEVPDRHERRRPQHQRHRHGSDREPALGGGGVHQSSLRTTADTRHAVIGRRTWISRRTSASFLSLRAVATRQTSGIPGRPGIPPAYRSSLYPSPRTVTRYLGSPGSGSSLARSRLTWTSRVLVSPT